MPVIRDANRKDIYETARSLAELAQKARAGKLAAARDAGRQLHDLEPRRHRRHGLHARSSMRRRWPSSGCRARPRSPVYHDGGFVPRLMLPLSLSYDHRVIDGANGARFTTSSTARAGRCSRPAGGRAVSVHEVALSRSRRLQGRRRHRRAGQARRSRRGRHAADHARDRQGHHGRALIGGRPGRRGAGEAGRPRVEGHAAGAARVGRGAAATARRRRPAPRRRQRHGSRNAAAARSAAAGLRRTAQRRLLHPGPSLRPSRGARARSCWCSARGPAAIRPLSARRTWG